jgi:hypothetical protein
MPHDKHGAIGHIGDELRHWPPEKVDQSDFAARSDNDEVGSMKIGASDDRISDLLRALGFACHVAHAGAPRSPKCLIEIISDVVIRPEIDRSAARAGQHGRIGHVKDELRGQLLGELDCKFGSRLGIWRVIYRAKYLSEHIVFFAVLRE